MPDTLNIHSECCWRVLLAINVSVVGESHLPGRTRAAVICI